MELFQLVKPLGMLGSFILLLTVISGLLHWNFTLHKVLGIIALAVALTHGAIVIFG